MRDRLYAAFKRELAPIEGIAKTLQALGIPFCVASSSQLERVRLSLEVTGLAAASSKAGCFPPPWLRRANPRRICS